MPSIQVNTAAAKKPPMTIGRIIDALPEVMLHRVADPGGNWEAGAMVQMKEVGDGVAEFRCLLGHVSAEFETAHGFMRREDYPEAVDFIILLYRNFGPTKYMKVAIRFDTLASRYGGQRLGSMIRKRAERQLLMREHTAHERRYIHEFARVPSVR